MSYHARMLPAAEWDRLKTEGPWAQAGLPVPPPEAIDVIVVEDEQGRILATQGITVFTHLEGLWTDPARPTVGSARRLWPEVQRVLREAGVRVVFAMAPDERLTKLYEHAGFTRLPVTTCAKALGE